MTTQNKDKLKIVGVGASAGGLTAFESLFVNLPVNTSLSYIIVQHLSPDTKSILPEILQRYTEIPVSQVTKTTQIEPNHIYVIPPNHDIGVSGDELHLFEPSAPRGFRLPIDFLFRSLAENFGPQTVGIVLSGTGSDGALGIKAIKGSGGLTIVQDPGTTKFTGMPVSAIQTGQVDYIVKVDEIADLIVHYFNNSLSMDVDHAMKQPDLADMLQKILIIVRDETGHDFSLYKPNTIVRRIERRMIVNRIDVMSDYLRYLQQTPLEVNMLFHDMLIGVTSFFRDQDAFAALKTQIIPKLFEEKPQDASIRVWVPGCSTSEEAISIAILLEEQARELDRHDIDIQVFATDIDNHAIEKAREGNFPQNIRMDIPEEYIDRYFVVEEPNIYRISKTIRQHLIFAEQNITKDPPFSNLDLVSCRNLLIYMTADLQELVLKIIHYALRANGYLFLGGSESISVVQELFSTINQRHRLFQKRNIQTQFHPSSRLYQSNNFNSALKTKADEAKLIRDAIESTLLEAYVPPSVIVNESGDILYHQGDTSLFWATATGESSLNILRVARRGLRAQLTVGIRKAITNKATLVFKNITIDVHRDRINLRMTLRPTTLANRHEPLVVISFEEIQPDVDKSSDAVSGIDGNITKRIQELQDEVKLKNEYLESTIQELEATNEELQSVNEEFQSSNEELRSTNEELETSREELQAINEELLTMNAELNNKIEQLDALNNDQRNILNNIHVGLLILNRDMLIRVFNPVAGHVFNLIETDTNRLITQLAPNFDYGNLSEDIQSVMRSLRPKSIEINVEDKLYLMRIHPYRTPEHDVNGVVITLTDITEIKEFEFDLRQNEQKLQSIFEVLPVGISLLDNNRKMIQFNTALGQILDITEEGLKAGEYRSRQYINNTGNLVEAYEFPSNRAIADKKAIHNEVIGIIKEDGKTIWTSVSAAPLDHPDLSAVVVTADITQQKNYEANIIASEQRLSSVLINSKTLVFEQDQNLKYVSLFNHNRAFTREQILGHYDTDLLSPEEAAAIIAIKKQVMETGEPYRFDLPANIDNKIFHYDMIIQPKYDVDDKTIIGIVASATDITDRKEAEQQLQLQSEILNNLSEGVYLIQTDTGEIVYTNPTFEAMFGYDTGEMIGQNVSIVNPHGEQSQGVTPEEIIHNLRETRIWSGEVHNIRKDGTTFWCYAHVSTFNHPEYGEVWVAVHQDITSQKQRDESLQKSEEQYRSFIELSPSAMLIHQLDKIVYINPIGLETFGATDKSQIIGKPTRGLIHPDSYDAIMTRLATAAETNEIARWAATTLLHIDGTAFDAMVSGQVITYEDKLSHLIVIHKLPATSK